MSIYDGFSPKELDILRARAERVARASTDDQHERVLTLLMVSTDSEKYALPVEMISAVYENVRIVPVPCAPPFVAGIANIRGRIVMALDLAALLGLPASGVPDVGALVTLPDDDLNAAFYVSAIGSVENVFASSIVPVPPNLPLAQPRYVQGLLPDGTVLLDLPAILNDPLPGVQSAQSVYENGAAN